jgi:hypothetical protein
LRAPDAATLRTRAAAPLRRHPAGPWAVRRDVAAAEAVRTAARGVAAAAAVCAAATSLSEGGLGNDQKDDNAAKDLTHAFLTWSLSTSRNQRRPLAAQASRPAHGRRAALKGCATGDFAMRFFSNG